MKLEFFQPGRVSAGFLEGGGVVGVEPWGRFKSPIVLRS